MGSGMFRGKESSNRIELSQLVQDLLNFGVLGSLWLWRWGVGGWGGGGGGVDGVGVVGGVPHTGAHACACTHVHARTCVHGKHDNSMQMATPMGEFLGIPYDVMCTCMCMHACMHVCAHVWGAPSHHPHPPAPHPPGGPPESVKIQ